MKHLVVFLLFVSSYSFTQNKYHEISCDQKTSIEKQKEKGTFIFQLPAEITKEHIDRNAKYYTNSFVVSYSKSNQLQIRMVTNDTANRMIIKRLFYSIKIDKINYNGSSYSVDDFYKQFLSE